MSQEKAFQFPANNKNEIFQIKVLSNYIINETKMDWLNILHKHSA
jgi:hypothetical protein